MISVLIDCDTGIDDALALTYLAALHHEGTIQLVGASTSAGNVDVMQASANTRWVLDRCHLSEVPAYPGRRGPRHVPLVTTPETHGYYGLGYVKPMMLAQIGGWRELWRSSIRNHPDLRLIVTGPATNLADFGPVANTTLMGGTYEYPGNTTPTAEWNSWVDPQAAQEVFAHASEPITVCSLGVTEQFTLDPVVLEEFVEALGVTPIARFLPDILRYYFEFHESQGEGYLAQIHDLVTCMIALDRIPFETVTARISVEAEDEHLRGTTTAEMVDGGDANARLVCSVDVAAAHAELLRAARVLAKVSEEKLTS